MTIQHDQAICVRHWDYSETSQTVGMFGRSIGCFRGLAKGARRERGRFSGGLDLLTRGEVGVILKGGETMATLTEWDVQEVFLRIRNDLHANRCAWYAADLLGRVLPPLDPHPTLFDRTVDLLRALERGEGSETSLLAFQWQLLVEIGWQPDLREPEGGPGHVAFDPREGRLVRDGMIEGAWRVRTSTLAVLRSLERQEPTEADAEAAARANRLLASHLRNMLGEEPLTMPWVFGRLPAAAARLDR